MSIILVELSGIQSITAEGPDQVGKGDTVISIANRLCKKGIETTVISFPNYATPIGEVINDVLHNGFSEGSRIDKEREVLVKMALFSLNRLEILNCILADRRNDVYVFDRGPFSHALSIAYYLSQGGEDYSMEELVDIGLGLDAYFREQLNIDECVIKLRIEQAEWNSSRTEEGDLHERRDVQQECELVYERMSKVIGKGWANITTRVGNIWRDREDIAKDCLKFVHSRLGISLRNNQGNDKTPKYLSIEDVQAHLYKGSEVEMSQREAWLRATRANDKGGIYGCAGGISKALADSVKEISWYNDEIKGVVRSILDLNEYPEVLYLLEARYGEEFVLKLLRSVND